MSDDANKIANYQRQRRNLLLVSALLILIEGAGVRLDSLAIQGYLLKIEKPDFILAALIVLLAYFFVRNYQYFSESFRDSFQNKVNYLLSNDPTCIEHMIRMFVLFNKEEFSFASENKLSVHLGNKPNVFKGYEGWSIEGPELVFLNPDKSIYKKMNYQNMAIDQRMIMEPENRAKWIVRLKTPEFTEHYFPFYFAGLALVISLWGKMCSSSWFGEMMINFYH